MTEENKPEKVELEKAPESKQEETTSPPAQEEETTEDKVVEDDSKIATSDNEIDYKELYEEEEKKRIKAENTIIKNKRKEKEETGIEDTTDYDNTNEVKEIIRTETKKIREDMVGDTIDTLGEKLCSNEDERKLVMFHYDNSIVQSGSSRKDILKDLKRAKLIANEKLILAENSELKTSLAAKNTLGITGIGSNQVRPNVKEKIELNSEEKSIINFTNRRREQQGKKPLTEEQFINNQT